MEVFYDHLQRCIGVRKIPLIYLQRDTVAVPNIYPPLTAGQLYSNEHGSIEEDLITRSYHTYGLFRDNRADVYYKLEEATRVTPYTNSIRPFQYPKNGRDALLALTSQYVGQEKWEA